MDKIYPLKSTCCIFWTKRWTSACVRWSAPRPLKCIIAHWPRFCGAMKLSGFHAPWRIWAVPLLNFNVGGLSTRPSTDIPLQSSKFYKYIDYKLFSNYNEFYELMNEFLMNSKRCLSPYWYSLPVLLQPSLLRIWVWRCSSSSWSCWTWRRRGRQPLGSSKPLRYPSIFLSPK